jgi:hypothetical protein
MSELERLERLLDDYVAGRRGRGLGAVLERAEVDALKARIAALKAQSDVQ